MPSETLIVRFNENGDPVVDDEESSKIRHVSGKHNASLNAPVNNNGKPQRNEKKRRRKVAPLWGNAKPPSLHAFDPSTMRIPWLATSCPRMGDKNIVLI